MTVYELIQELAQYDADDDVEFRVEAEFDCDVDVDLEGGETQTVEAEFDDTVSLDEIRHSVHTVYIDLEY